MNWVPTIEVFARDYGVGRDGWHFEAENRPDSRQILIRCYKGEGREIKYASAFIDEPLRSGNMHGDVKGLYDLVGHTFEYLRWYAQLTHGLIVGTAGKWRKYGR